MLFNVLMEDLELVEIFAANQKHCHKALSPWVSDVPADSERRLMSSVWGIFSNSNLGFYNVINYHWELC